jgi:hypothetical protein
MAHRSSPIIWQAESRLDRMYVRGAPRKMAIEEDYICPGF